MGARRLASRSSAARCSPTAAVAHTDDLLRRPAHARVRGHVPAGQRPGASASAATSATTRTRSSRSGIPGDPFGIYAHQRRLAGRGGADARCRASASTSPHRFRIEWTPTHDPLLRRRRAGGDAQRHDRAGDAPGRRATTASSAPACKVALAADEHLPDHRARSPRARSTAGPGANDWQTLTVQTARRPAGTAITFQTRSGDTRQPDATWSAWQNVGAGGAIASPNARYIQYRATLHGGDARRRRRSSASRSATARAPTRRRCTGTVSLAPDRAADQPDADRDGGGFSDPDGDPLTYHYEWFRNGTQIAGATTQHAQPRAGRQRRPRRQIRVEVYATDGRGAASDAGVGQGHGRQHGADGRHGHDRARRRRAPTTSCARSRAASPTSTATTLTYHYQWLATARPIAGRDGPHARPRRGHGDARRPRRRRRQRHRRQRRARARRRAAARSITEHQLDAGRRHGRDHARRARRPTRC